MWRPSSLEKTLMLGKTAGKREDDRGWDGWIASQIQCTWVEQTPGNGEGKPGVLRSLGSQTVRHNWATEQIVKGERS